MTDTLDRRLGLVASVAVGVGAMVGAGLFVVFGPAVEAAGSGIVAALVIAAAVAGCNAISSARLARLYPVAGGTYVYGRERLGPFWGHLAGWSFVAGKLASCGVMALAVGSYLWPEHDRVVAAAVVVLVTAINLAGVEKSARAGIVVVVLVLTVVLVAVVTMATAPGAPSATATVPTDARGVLTAAGLLFFAFAGYARLATLGEEVRRPERTIPRAIGIAVVIVVAVYAAAVAALLHVLGQAGLADASRPFVSGVRAAGAESLVPVVGAAATLAAGGALLSLTLGVSRTTFAMSRDHHLPAPLSRVARVQRVPWVAELAVAAVVLLLVALGDLVTGIAFSSFCVLTYYAVANAAALTLRSNRVGTVMAATGLVGCGLLAFTLPLEAVVTGAVVVAVGAASYGVRQSLARGA